VLPNPDNSCAYDRSLLSPDHCCAPPPSLSFSGNDFAQRAIVAVVIDSIHAENAAM
jgi:hypothetical protein